MKKNTDLKESDLIREHYTFTWDESLQMFKGSHQETGIESMGTTLRATRYALYALVTAHYEQQRKVVREVFAEVVPRDRSERS